MTRPTLAVELFTEELPPRALKRLGEAFAEGIAEGLALRGFLDDRSRATPFATPRRLAVSITQVRATSPEQAFRQKILPVSIAFDAAGQPTPVLEKRLAALGLADAASLKRESDGKSDVLFHEGLRPGVPISAGLQATLDDTIAKLPIPKVMSYAGADGSTVRFVRPAHRLLALHGADIVPIHALGLTAGRGTGGHRFLGRRALDVATADAYEETLRAEGKVVASFDERRALIVAALGRAASGATVIMPDALLDEVNALVEWPAVYAGTFDAAFLDVPQECLILTMQQNQKYFALADREGRLQPRFLLVSNLETNEPEAIIRGNERVLRARLADARFFFDQDRKTTLASRVERLKTIVFHNKLGSQADRVERLRRIANALAPMLGADPRDVDRAALLAKADLVTDMVGEFPELQGLMGRYYARNDGEPSTVADAIAQHYWPRYAGDALPERAVAQAVALADKLEALAGMFGIGQVPTGDKDPFGLRRAALGLIRILIEKGLPLPLPALARLAFEAFDGVPAIRDAHTEVETFVYERLRGYLRDLGYTANQIAAVVDARPAEIHLLPSRLAAVQSFEALPESGALAAANKRIVNILRKADGEAAPAVDRSRLTNGAEHDLWLEFQKLEPVVDEHCARSDFAGALLALAAAKAAVDRFFDEVMVMAEDPAIRANRLALLRGVAHTMNRVADISKLAS